MGEPPQPAELRRSFAKLDFNALTRERSFVRPHQHPQIKDGKQRRGGGVAIGRGKPTMEIYRPPIGPLIADVRTDLVNQNGLSLNVHAKEFTMKQGDNHSNRSSLNLSATPNHIVHQHPQRGPHQLQQSKSSGNVLHSLQHNHKNTVNNHVTHPLQQSVSTANILQAPRVHFSDMPSEMAATPSLPAITAHRRSPLKSCSVSAFHEPVEPIRAPISPPSVHPNPGIKRSKSLGAADVVMGVVKEAPDLGSFPADVQGNIRKAVEDPNLLPARTLMELVRHIMERAVSSVVYALPAAKLCITIIEREKKETFLESLLNSCQQWHQERDRVLKGTGVTTPRYSAFMQFLNEMYCELKRRQLQLKTQQQGAPPGLVLLTLLCKCCQECLKTPQTQGQTDSLFFVLTSVGRDMEQEIPSKLYSLISSVRDTFLSSPSKPQIKKTLLQLIELHAARWQLPAAAVVYYTTQQ